MIVCVSYLLICENRFLSDAAHSTNYCAERTEKHAPENGAFNYRFVDRLWRAVD